MKIPLKFRFPFVQISDLLKSKEKREQDKIHNQKVDKLVLEAHDAWQKQLKLLLIDHVSNDNHALEFMEDNGLRSDVYRHFIWGFVFEHESENSMFTSPPSMIASTLTMMACLRYENFSFEQSRACGIELDKRYNADDEIFGFFSNIGRAAYLNPAQNHLSNPVKKIMSMK